MPYNHPISTITTAASDPLTAGHAIYWSVTDDGPRGAVQFLTQTKIHGHVAADLPKAALYRMVCFYLIGKLAEESLAEACESLADIYNMQEFHITSHEVDNATTRFVPASRATRVANPPFVR
jgi:hypothetical protein